MIVFAVTYKADQEEETEVLAVYNNELDAIHRAEKEKERMKEKVGDYYRGEVNYQGALLLGDKVKPYTRWGLRD